MRICTLSSGSSGNCVYAGTDNTHILIDAGISSRKIEKGLNGLGLTLRDMDAVLVTHEHFDHISGLGVISRKSGLPVYTAKKTYEAVLSSGNIGKMPEGIFRVISADKDFSIKDIHVHPFSLIHDAADPLGFRLTNKNKSFAVATDLGSFDDYIISRLKNLDVILVEANHDVRMLEAGSYPYYLKQRILSRNGHLSNDDAGKLVSSILHDHIKKIILGHLSGKNNYPALAYQTVSSEITLGEGPYTGGDFNISVAERDLPGDLIEW